MKTISSKFIMFAMLFCAIMIGSFSTLHAKNNNLTKKQIKAAVVGKTFQLPTLIGTGYYYLSPNGSAYMVSKYQDRPKRSFWSVRYFVPIKKLAICIGETRLRHCGPLELFQKSKVANGDKYELASGKFSKTLFPKNYFHKRKKRRN